MKYLQIFWGLIRNIKGLYTIGILLTCIEAFSFVAAQAAQKYMIDDIFIAEKYERLIWVLGYFALTHVLWLGSLVAVPFFLQKCEQLISLELSTKLLKKMHKLPISNLNKERIGGLVNYFTNDIKTVSYLVSTDIPRGFQQGVRLIVLMIVLGLASPVILLFITLLSLIYIAIGRYIAPKLNAVTKSMQTQKADYLIRVEESISATREIISYNRQDWDEYNLNRSFNQYFGHVMKEGKLHNKNLLLSDPIRWLTTILVIGYGGYLVLNGQLSIGMFIITYQFAAELLLSINGVYQVIMEFSGKIVFLQRINTLMDQPKFQEGDKRIKGAVNTISYTKLGVSSPDSSTILTNIELQIPVKETVAIVGKSGSGKTTIANLLVRIIDPTVGSIQINGIDIRELKYEDWIQRLGIVFQENYIFADTVKNNLLMGKEGVAQSELEEICRLVLIHDTIMALPDGYNTQLGERGINFSGGQRQRLAIARALLKKPEILILDEATSALDTKTEKELLRNLQNKLQGKTIITIAHRLSSIQDAKFICVIDEGKIVLTGTHDELWDASQIYRKLLQSQVG